MVKLSLWTLQSELPQQSEDEWACMQSWLGGIVWTDVRGEINLTTFWFAGDTGSNLDYSGGRKTHRFPPPYWLGSHSLTHRPTENPTGMTLWQGLQGILNHAPLFRMTTKAPPPYGKLPIPSFPNQGKEPSPIPVQGTPCQARSDDFLFCHSGPRAGVA